MEGLEAPAAGEGEEETLAAIVEVASMAAYAAAMAGGAWGLCEMGAATAPALVAGVATAVVGLVLGKGASKEQPVEAVQATVTRLAHPQNHLGTKLRLHLHGFESRWHLDSDQSR